MREEKRVQCCLCLMPGAMKFRLDKAGRPYGRCINCMSVAFTASADALAHWEHTNPEVIEWFKESRRPAARGEAPPAAVAPLKEAANG